MEKLSTLDWIALILVIVGAINWGLVATADFNLVNEIFGGESTLAQIVYILVGVSGLYLAAIANKLAKA